MTSAIPTSTPHQQRIAIAEKVRGFFAEGALSDKIAQADELRQMPGVDSFRTPLPWKLALPDGLHIIGNSEDLATGVSDIHARLSMIRGNLTDDAIIKPEIDNNRLKLMAQSSAIFNQGGERGK